MKGAWVITCPRCGCLGRLQVEVLEKMKVEEMVAGFVCTMADCYPTPADFFAPKKP